MLTLLLANFKMTQSSVSGVRHHTWWFVTKSVSSHCPIQWLHIDNRTTAGKWVRFEANHTLQWRHNGRDVVSNHRRLDCLLNCLFRCRSNKTSKFRVTGLCGGDSLVTGEFPSQRASNAENVFIWWRHEIFLFRICGHVCPGVYIWSKNKRLSICRGKI